MADKRFLRGIVRFGVDNYIRQNPDLFYTYGVRVLYKKDWERSIIGCYLHSICYEKNCLDSDDRRWP